MFKNKLDAVLLRIMLIGVVGWGLGVEVSQASQTLVLEPTIISGADIQVAQTGRRDVVNGSTTASVPLQEITINSNMSNNNMVAFSSVLNQGNPGHGLVFSTDVMIGASSSLTPFLAPAQQNAVIITGTPIPSQSASGGAWEGLRIILDAGKQRITVSQYVNGSMIAQFTAPLALVPYQTYSVILNRYNGGSALANSLSIIPAVRGYAVEPNQYSPYPDPSNINNLYFNETFSQMGLNTSFTLGFGGTFSSVYVGTFRSTAKFMSPAITLI